MSEDLRDGGVVVGMDGSEQAIGAARWAARWADLRRQELVLLTALNDPDTRDGQVEAILADLVPALQSRYPQLSISQRTVGAYAVDILVEESESAELVVLGTQRLGGVVGKFLGSVADNVVAKARGPVGIVPIGTDGSSGDVLLGMDLVVPPLEAARVAFVAAEAFNSTVIACLVDDQGRPATLNSPDGDFSELEPGMGRDVQVLRTLESICSDFPGVDCAARVEVGETADALLDLAEDAGIFVIGSRRRNALMSILFGSMSRTVTRETPCPAILVPVE